MRAGLRAISTLLGFLHVWLAARVRVPFLAPRARAQLAGALSLKTLARLGIAVRVRGEPARRGACLLVANHVSWLDVQVLSGIWGARFVAKVETSRWPVVGGIARGFGALFVRRESIRDAARTKDVVARALASGELVAVFPEGTTTDGTELRRFHPAFFQAALDARVAVQPVALRYCRADGSTNRAASFVGDMTFLASLWNVIREPALTVEVSIARPLSPYGRDRRALAAAAQRSIPTALALPAQIEPAPPPRQRPRRSAA